MICHPSFIKCQGFLNTLHVSKTRISLRGKHTKHVCADPRTRSPRVVSQATETYWDSPVQGALPACFHLGLRVLWEPDEFLLLEESVLSWLSWPGSQLSMGSSCASFLQMRQEDGGWAEVRAVNPAQEGYYPLAQLQINGFWRADGAIHNQIEERQIQWRSQATLPSLPTDGQAPLITQLQRYTLNYLCLKFQLGMVIWV